MVCISGQVSSRRCIFITATLWYTTLPRMNRGTLEVFLILNVTSSLMQNCHCVPAQFNQPKGGCMLCVIVYGHAPFAFHAGELLPGRWSRLPARMLQK